MEVGDTVRLAPPHAIERISTDGGAGTLARIFMEIDPDHLVLKPHAEIAWQKEPEVFFVPTVEEFSRIKEIAERHGWDLVADGWDLESRVQKHDVDHSVYPLEWLQRA